MSQVSPETLYFIRYVHPEKTVFRNPEVTGLDETALCAALFGMPKDRYLELKQQFAGIVRRAAGELLSDPAFAAGVDRLPFQPGDCIVGLGDSITDDLQSWVEQLRHVLELRRPGHRIQVINAGISGDTTTQMIIRFLQVAQQKPNWIICMAGTNDARLHGVPPDKPLVSIEETRRNLAFLRQMGKSQTKARWVWITPPPILPAKVERDPWFLANQITWRVEDVDAVAQAVRSQPDPVVDLYPVFGDPPDERYLIGDGLHPSLEGQKLILRALIKTLAGEHSA